MPYLVALTGPYTGEAFPLKDGRATVGRGAGCDIVLERDRAVSRAHAVLITKGGVIEVQDAGSKHGVLVNGQAVSRKAVRTGDCVQFGASCFQVQPVPAQIGEPVRLRVVMPKAAPAAPTLMAGNAPMDPPVPPATGAMLLLLAILVPVPAGFLIGARYLKRKNPTNRRFGVWCLALSALSLIVQVALSVRLTVYLLQMLQAPLDPNWGL